LQPRPGAGGDHRPGRGAGHRAPGGHEPNHRTGGESEMKLFLDTANLEEIREIKRWGVLSGCTTNPSLLAKEHSDWEMHMRAEGEEVDGAVAVETTESKAGEIYEQGRKLAAVAPNAVVKVVMTPEGIAAGKRLADEGIPVNVTLVFSP